MGALRRAPTALAPVILFMKFSIIITTQNRCVDLRLTCLRISSLRPIPHEVLICADGCSDGTVEMVRSEFSGFLLCENKIALGSVASRNHLLRSATGDVVVSLDDDSYPLDEDFLSKLSDLFTKHPEAAVISLPEIRDDGSFSHALKTDKTPGHYVSAYANCAAAMRREFYLQQPGFPDFFRHMYEEPDYALQCYAAGLAVWFEPSLKIRHHQSAVGRERVKRHQQNARNELWSVWMRCPWPWICVVSLFRILTQFRAACSQGFTLALREPVWWYQALAGIGNCLRARRPVPWSRYYSWMRLARRPIFSANALTTLNPVSNPL
jgi:GT2 family glycosyltransferase